MVRENMIEFNKLQQDQEKRILLKISLTMLKTKLWIYRKGDMCIKVGEGMRLSCFRLSISVSWGSEKVKISNQGQLVWCNNFTTLNVQGTENCEHNGLSPHHKSLWKRILSSSTSVWREVLENLHNDFLGSFLDHLPFFFLFWEVFVYHLHVVLVPIH